MRRSALLTIPLLALLFPAAAPLRAEEPATMDCVHEFVLIVAPGAQAASQDFTYTSGGQTGTIVCQGSLGGRRVSGPGTIGVEGTMQGSCFEGKGTGTNRLSVPTDQGVIEFVEPFAVAYRGTVGTYEGERMSGHFQFIPAEGNCVSAPMTKALVVAEDRMRL